MGQGSAKALSLQIAGAVTLPFLAGAGIAGIAEVSGWAGWTVIGEAVAPKISKTLTGSLFEFILPVFLAGRWLERSKLGNSSNKWTFQRQ